VPSIFEAGKGLVAVEAGELSVVARVLVSVELLFGEDVAAGLSRGVSKMTIQEVGVKRRISLLRNAARGPGQSRTSQLKDTMADAPAWASAGAGFRGERANTVGTDFGQQIRPKQAQRDKISWQRPAAGWKSGCWQEKENSELRLRDVEVLCLCLGGR